MERYFDAFVYVANWGTHEFMLRPPRHLVDPEVVRLYGGDRSIKVRFAGDFAVAEFLSEDEDGDFDDGTEWMAALLPVREDLAGGDLRALYLGWLLSAWTEELDEEAIEPPVPPGLQDLSPSLQALVDFLEVDEDLIAVAAEGSARFQDVRPTRAAYEEWIAGLAESEKNGYLLGLMEGAGLHLGADLRQRFRRAMAPTNLQAGEVSQRRTVGQLLRTAEERTEARRQAEAERLARERAKRQAEQAAARAKHLDRLAMNELQAWQRVDALIDTKRPTEYDQAVALLVDLRDMSARTGRAEAYAECLRNLRERHARKPSLMERFERAKL